MGTKSLNKVAVIFGGSRGIGRAIAEKFAIEGFAVAVASRNPANLKETCKYLSDRVPGGNFVGISCDVRSLNEIENCFSELNSKFRHIDVLVNSAGINKDSLLIRANANAIKDLIDTNLIGSIFTCKTVLKTMIKQHSGSIVNIGSVVGSKGNIGQVCYSASKSGLVGLTLSLAKEVGSRNITVNMVTPGPIKTEMTKDIDVEPFVRSTCLKRIGLPNEVADAVYFLSQASYVTGTVLPVDGGIL